MLYTRIITFIMAMSIPLVAMATPATVKSNYNTVPQWERTATAPNSPNDAKHHKQYWTQGQREGTTLGTQSATTMIHRFGHNPAAQQFARGISEHWHAVQTASLQAAAHALHLQAKTRVPQLYYFISFSMPKVLIQSYMRDAIWNGGILVLRGVTPGMSMGTFIRKRLMPLVQYKGAHARITLNPNLYERYHITHVPTLVIGLPRQGIGCHAVMRLTPKEHIPYQHCLPAATTEYWSLSGNVSTQWALQRLQAAGAPTAIFRQRMQGLSQGQGKQEPYFKGDWKDASLPVTTHAIDAMLARAGKAQTDNGTIGAVQVIHSLSKASS